MATKTFKVALSLDNPRIIQSGITVQSFDKQSVKISIALTKDSQTYQIPIGATIRISLLKLSNQAQKIIVDVPNDNRESIDWIVPDYLDGYHGVVRCGVYLLHGTESVDLGYFTILSNVSDIDKMAEEFTDNVFGGWEAIEEELRELNFTIAQTKLDLAADMTQVDNTIANINEKNTQVNSLASDFTADVATKQSDVTSKYNAFDTSVTQAGQTIDEILALQPQFQSVLDETTGKDVISAPEIILARGGAQTLGERLDDLENKVIVESGSNSNGKWTKFADGTMICTHRMFSASGITTPYGSLFRTDSTYWDFPQPFFGFPVMSATCQDTTAYSFVAMGAYGTYDVNGTFSVINSKSDSKPVLVGLTAIGPWK